MTRGTSGLVVFLDKSTLLTLARMHSEGYCTWFVCVCVCLWGGKKIEGGLRGERLVSAVTVHGGPNFYGYIIYQAAPAGYIYMHIVVTGIYMYV